MRSAVPVTPLRALPVITGLGLLVAVACYQPVELPPLNPVPTGAHLPGKFIWRDLLTKDVVGAQAFYGALFGWEFRAVAGGDYVVILREGKPIGGIVRADRKVKVEVSQWASWLSVADVDTAVATVRAAGGQVLRAPLVLKGRGRLAVVTDPEGALLVLVRSTDGDPRDAEAGVGDWLWTELWTHDKPGSLTFYQRLAGYTTEERQVAGATYPVFMGSGAPRAGVVANPFEDVGTNWLPYVRVDDVGATVARVQELGGRLLVEPREDRRAGSAAIVADPTGAAFVVQKWPIEGERARKR